MVYVEFVGLVVDPPHGRSAAPVYARVAHLLAPRTTSDVNRPPPHGVITSRPRR